MKRRNALLGLASAPLSAATLFAATPPNGSAAAAPVAGTDYQTLQPAMPVLVPGKPEVIEFFGYWCPHCNAFEADLEPWLKTLPADVNVRRIPVAWQEAHTPYQRLFFALEALGLKSDVHPKVFNAFHVQGLRLDNEAGFTKFAAVVGVDKVKLADAMRSFSVAGQIKTATQQAINYQIEGVPTLVINGKYVTSPEIAHGGVQSLKVADALIRQGRGR